MGIKVHYLNIFLFLSILFAGSLLLDSILIPFLHEKTLICSKFCHQIKIRSFNLEDFTFGLCARCLGIYLSIFLTLIFILIRECTVRITILFFITLFVTIISLFLKLIQFDSNNSLRFIFGLCTGYSVVLTIVLTIHFSVKLLGIIMNKIIKI